MAATTEIRVNPYLHIGSDRIYNPLTDRAISAGDPEWLPLQRALRGDEADASLEAGGWIVRDDPSRQFRLKIVSLETLTTCNQKCYFCPVSIAPRPDEEMPMEVFERIVGELVAFRSTIEGVFLQNYNEPTVDRRFVDLCRVLFTAGLPVAVLTNGSGLTPARTDALLQAGMLEYLCVNLSTIDRARYQQDRGADHLALVLKNVDYMAEKPLARRMRIIVLGEDDEAHLRDFDKIRERFAGTRFEIEKFHINDRAGWLDLGLRRPEPIQSLGGCDLLGSRPLQHLHITPVGKCILCCQDYEEKYVVGDLTKATIADVLQGPEMQKIRRWVYGVDDAPADFICRTCVWALQRR